MRGDRRLAWFSPLPPERSGVAAYSAELLPHLEETYDIARFDASRAHEFVWRHRRQPYDLVVYHLGNAPCHDYVWAYLAAYPGLVVLHDARLHHARARQLLAAGRVDDYRAEFRYDHPDVRRNVTEYAVAGLGGAISYLWPMRRVVLRTARLVAVHSARVAAELRDEEPEAAIDVVRMGVPAATAPPDARGAIRRRFGLRDEAIVFAAFGKMTAEKRLAPIAQALGALSATGRDVHLLLVGDGGDSPLVASLLTERLAPRVHVAGYVADSAIDAHLAAADVCLCLRWPTALETSASWLRCLAAGRATIVTDLAHTADVPAAAARRVDLLDEDQSLLDAMRELTADAGSRAALADAGRAWWAAHHTMAAMAGDYRRVIDRALAAPAPSRPDLPPHFLDDHSAPTRALAHAFGVPLDL